MLLIDCKLFQIPIPFSNVDLERALWIVKISKQIQTMALL